jgi:hypothetical protein
MARNARQLSANLQLERMYETVPASNGSAAAHTVVRCTLADLARAMNLCIKDAGCSIEGRASAMR